MKSKIDIALRDYPTQDVKKFKKDFCGDFINNGIHRDVYIFKPDERYVVKIERNTKGTDFTNASEWRNYINCVSWTQFSKWLAPCEYISWSGRILIQRRIKHKAPELYPKKIPSLFTDLKYSNYGWIGKQFVCCDYPFLILGVKFRMKTTRWWGKGL